MGEVEFYGTSDWGWSVIMILFGSAAIYLRVGMARNFRVDGSTGLAALPHRAFWLEEKALVADGVLFSRHRLRSKAGRSRRLKPARQSLLENHLHDHSDVGEVRSDRKRKTKKNEKRTMRSQDADAQQTASKSDLAASD